MTFKQFKLIAETARHDVTVNKHGEYNYSSDGTKVMVTYKGSDKGYFFNGSYQSILCKLGIKTVDLSDIQVIEKELAGYRSRDGKPGLFGKGVQSYSRQIAECESRLAEYRSDAYIRVWEW